ncbi:hypothetical protein BBJ28_00023668 [Nothophytophthora sp. Chile5]|nr:hypothetical protein BBJ28_00023668 [Nothophytophthora sp. Chile5]
MPRADEVDLRVRAYGQRGLEFALRRSDYEQGRAWAARCGVLALLLAASGVLLAWERRPSRSAHALLLLGLALVALAIWIYQASGAVVVEGASYRVHHDRLPLCMLTVYGERGYTWMDLTEAMLVVPALGVKLSKRRRNGATSSEVRTYMCSYESGGFCLLSKLSLV